MKLSSGWVFPFKAISESYEHGNGFNLLKFIICLIVLAAASLICRTEHRLVGRPITEDGYYSFTVANNIAQGKGITIDGSTLTNGFQPLFTFLSIPAFILVGGNRYEAIQLVMILHWLFYLATAFLLGIIAQDAFQTQERKKKRLLFWSVVFIYLSSVSIFLLNFNGLETGCLLFFYSATWRYYQIGRLEQWRGLIMLGIMLGLLVLVRIDALFLVIIISLHQVFSQKQFKLTTRIGRLATVGGVAFIISSPWWIYNLLNFGALIPTSGKAQQAWLFSWDRIGAAIVAFFQEAMPIIYLGTATYEGFIIDLARIALIIAVIVFLWKMRSKLFDTCAPDGSISLTLRRTLEFGSSLIISTIIITFWYTFSSFATWFYLRYFSSLLLLSTLIIGFILWQIGNMLPRAVSVLLVALPIPLLVSIALLHKGSFTNEYYENQLTLTKKYVPDSEYIGAFQSGTFGYFREHVVNLDGKVNPEALQYKNDLMAYVHKKKINWLCDWHWKISQLLQTTPDSLSWEQIGTKGNFGLYHYVGISH